MDQQGRIIEKLATLFIFTSKGQQALVASVNNDNRTKLVVAAIDFLAVNR